MKKILFYTLLAVIISACNSMPEPYSDALELIKRNKFENAMEMLKMITIQDKEWYDSAAVKKNLVFGLLIKQKDWERTFAFIEKEMDDASYKNEMKRYFLENSIEQIKNGGIDSLIIVQSINERKISEFLGDEVTNKIVELISDNVLKGIWKGLNLEYFVEKEDNTYLFKINVTAGDYKKGELIYKINKYRKNLVFSGNGIIANHDPWLDLTLKRCGTATFIRTVS